MTFSLLSKLSLQGIWKRHKIYFPYVLAIILRMALEFVMISLINNEYVQTRHATLVVLVGIGVFFSTLLATVFILYANNFIQKQRRQEFALYTVLGLERRHTRQIILLEQVTLWLITSILSVLMGYTLGNVMFIALNRLMRDTGATLMDYTFDSLALILTIVFLFGIFTLIFIMNSRKLMRLKPAELLAQKNAGEAEPKSRWLLLLIGLVTLAAGYYVALSTTGVLESLTNVFIAIFLVVIATYCLFISLSIIILKRLKRNKTFYYQAKNFLSISGLLYRMKANATSLASIAILCTGLVLTLGTTLTLYLGMDNQVANIMPRDYSLEVISAQKAEDAVASEEVNQYLDQILLELEQEADLGNIVAAESIFINSYYEGNQFDVLPAVDQVSDLDINNVAYIIAQPLADFNAMYYEEYELADGEVLVATTDRQLAQHDWIELAGQEYGMTLISDEYLPSNLVGNILYVVVPDSSALAAMQETYLMRAYNSDEMYQVPVDQAVYFDVAQGQSINLENSFYSEGDMLVRMSSKEEVSSQLYSLNGGFLFLGIIVGMVLIIGIILMLYFKQISEGYDDQGKFQIMKQVGLPNDLIKKTIRAQIFWVFVLPLAVAVIHSIAASKIMFELLSLLSIRSLSTFAAGYGTVLVVFIIVYFILYLMTSRVYYEIINTEGQRI